MLKTRKSSLSPCLQNKENMPLNQISFKNLQRAKRNVHQTFQYGMAAQSSNQSFVMEPERVSQSFLGDAQRRNKRESEEYRTVLKSKQKQMGSLQSQVKVLQSTIDLLREQLEHSTKENKRLGGINGNHSKIMQEKEELLNRYCLENAKLQKQLKEYHTIGPKLNQLEDIQDNLMEENRRLKGREQIMRSVLRDIKNLIKCDTRDVKAEIIDLIRVVIG